MKKKILVVALGYPTKENPFEGSFFREQVDFLSTEYECSVLVYKEYVKGLILPKKIEYSELEYTEGIKQYYPVVTISAARRICELIGAEINKKRKHEIAVGIYRSSSYRKHRRRVIGRIIDDLQLMYDLVYCISAQGTIFQARQFAEIRNKPFVISEHRPYPHPGWATIDVEKEAFEKADCFLAISRDKIRQVMLQDIKLKRVAYIGNLIDEQKFVINPQEHDYPTLLIVAAHSYFKNFDMFIETINKLVDKTQTEFRVIMAGYGANKGYAEDTDILEQKVQESKFADKAELIPEVSREDICKLYNRADALVLTSIQEGQPMVALEATCCGLPIFSTRCGGVEDYVTDEVGRLVDIIDSEKLAAHLCDFIDGRITFESEKVRDKVVKMFGRKAFLYNIKTEFDRLINT